jgi:glutathione S-transferase
VLFESNTIVRYLARRYGQGTLAPADSREYARSEKWMDWASIGLESSLSPLWLQHLLKNYPAFAAQSPALAARYASESGDKLIGAVVRWFEILSAGLPRMSSGSAPTTFRVIGHSATNTPSIFRFCPTLGTRSPTNSAYGG